MNKINLLLYSNVSCTYGVFERHPPPLSWNRKGAAMLSCLLSSHEDASFCKQNRPLPRGGVVATNGKSRNECAMLHTSPLNTWGVENCDARDAHTLAR